MLIIQLLIVFRPDGAGEGFVFITFSGRSFQRGGAEKLQAQLKKEEGHKKLHLFVTDFTSYTSIHNTMREIFQFDHFDNYGSQIMQTKIKKIYKYFIRSI